MKKKTERNDKPVNLGWTPFSKQNWTKTKLFNDIKNETKLFNYIWTNKPLSHDLTVRYCYFTYTIHYTHTHTQHITTHVTQMCSCDLIPPKTHTSSSRTLQRIHIRTQYNQKCTHIKTHTHIYNKHTLAFAHKHIHFTNSISHKHIYIFTTLSSTLTHSRAHNNQVQIYYLAYRVCL